MPIVSSFSPKCIPTATCRYVSEKYENVDRNIVCSKQKPETLEMPVSSIVDKL